MSMYTRRMREPDVTSLSPDPVVQAYKRDVDRTLLARNLALTPTERLEQLQRFVDFVADLRAAPRQTEHDEHGGQKR